MLWTRTRASFSKHEEYHPYHFTDKARDMFSWPSGWQEVGAMDNVHWLEQHPLPEQGEPGSTFSHFRVDSTSVNVRLSKPPKRLDLEAKAAWWKHSERNTKLYRTRPPGNEEVVLTLNQEGWSFISLTLSRGRSKIKKESKPQILSYTFQS